MKIPFLSRLLEIKEKQLELEKEQIYLLENILYEISKPNN
jgi:hypothetical protein